MKNLFNLQPVKSRIFAIVVIALLASGIIGATGCGLPIDPGDVEDIIEDIAEDEISTDLTKPLIGEETQLSDDEYDIDDFEFEYDQGDIVNVSGETLEESGAVILFYALPSKDKNSVDFQIENGMFCEITKPAKIKIIALHLAQESTSDDSPETWYYVETISSLECKKGYMQDIYDFGVPEN